MIPAASRDAWERARALVARAQRVAVLTGAGVSAESGVPTFRGAGGLWRRHRPEDLATPEAFERDPRLVWEWYDWRRDRLAAARPNPAHHALVEWERRSPVFTLATQNVDGLHQVAGSRDPILLHGDIWTLRCVSCGLEEIDRRTPLPELPPRCRCGGLLRPGVVWFGEPLPEGALDRAAAAVAEAEVLLLIGTSAVVWPAAGLGEVALRGGVPVIEVNPEPTSYTARVISVTGRAGEVLPELIGAVDPPVAEP